MAEASKYKMLEESIAKLLANIRRDPDTGSAESKAVLTLGFILGLEARAAAEQKPA